jgi:hypothetical protein
MRFSLPGTPVLRAVTRYAQAPAVAAAATLPSNRVADVSHQVGS